MLFLNDLSLIVSMNIDKDRIKCKFEVQDVFEIIRKKKNYRNSDC